jgi:hypothetical protein
LPDGRIAFVRVIGWRNATLELYVDERRRSSALETGLTKALERLARTVGQMSVAGPELREVLDEEQGGGDGEEDSAQQSDLLTVRVEDTHRPEALGSVARLHGGENQQEQRRSHGPERCEDRPHWLGPHWLAQVIGNTRLAVCGAGRSSAAGGTARAVRVFAGRKLDARDAEAQRCRQHRFGRDRSRSLAVQPW